MKIKHLFLLLIISFSVQATSIQEIGWNDLVPATDTLEDPFSSLSGDQIYELSIVVNLRDRAKVRELSEPEQAELKESLNSLSSQGIDIDSLISQRMGIIEKRKAAAHATKAELNGVEIKMPGFLLPLNFDNDEVTEFLLVPFVGACIHVPPPPPNQIVYVKYDKGFKHQGLYQPIWLSGKLNVGESRQNLFLGDGDSDIPVGYSMEAYFIEPYNE
jgi:hypothetical protein